MPEITLSQIVARLGGVLRGDGARKINRVCTLESAKGSDAAFLSNPRYRKQLLTTGAGVVVLEPDWADDCPVASIATPQPYLYFARLAQWLAPDSHSFPGTHSSAVVETELPDSVSVGPSTWIGPGASIGENVTIMANCSIGAGVSIGADSTIQPNVTIYSGARIGQRALIHAGAVIGADGFGFARETNGSWCKIPQTGSICIGNDVEIGAGTTIDRGAIEDTVIEDGVKLDNQIQVGHNVFIGAHTAMAGCVGIAGSARVGRRCTVGGGSIILGHIKITDDVNIAAGTLISKPIEKPGTYSGTIPALDRASWLKNFSHLRHLDGMADKIRALELRLRELEKNR